MRLPKVSAGLPPNSGVSAPPKSKGRLILYAVGGCGCLTLAALILLVVGFAALGSLADSDSMKFSSKSGVTFKRTSFSAVLSPPSKKRKDRGRKVANTFLTHLAKGRTQKAWAMSSSPLKKVLKEEKGFDDLTEYLQKIAPHKKRYLFKRDVSTLTGSDGDHYGVQRLTFEFRSGKERRAVECVVTLLDSEIMSEEHSMPKREDFKITSCFCDRKYISFRKSWGDKPVGEFAKYGESFREGSAPNWPLYSVPPDRDKVAERVITDLKNHVLRGDYKAARKLLSPEARKTKPDLAKGIRDMLEVNGKSSAKKAKITFRKWSSGEQFDIWLADGVMTGTATVAVTLPPKDNVELTFVFGLSDHYDTRKPADQAQGPVYMGKITLEQKRLR